jgi:hypothetical protein
MFFQFSGFFVVFKIMQWDVKKQIKKAIKQGLPECELVVLKFPNDRKIQKSMGVKWIEKHEFRYKGNMYDIVRSKIEGENIIFYCINDHKEEVLFANLNSQINKELSANNSKAKTLQLLKKINFQYVYNSFKVNISDYYSQLTSYIYFEVNYKKVFKEVITPPPQSFLSNNFISII